MTATPQNPAVAPVSGPPAPVGLPPKRRGRPYGEWLIAALLLIPNLTLLVIFTYRPLLDNIRLSFTDWNISSSYADYIGLENYKTWLEDPNSHQVLLNTLIFTVTTVVVSLVLGLALAMLLDQRLRGRNLVRSAIFAPFVISGAAVGLALKFVFDPNFGLIRDLGHRVGISTPDFYERPGWALFMVTVTFIWKNLGYTFVIYLAALQGRRADLDEAAEIDGASAWRRFTRVLLPQLRATTFFLSITVLLNSVQLFDILNVMTGGGPQGYGSSTMVYQIYQETFKNSKAGYGATIATVMFLILLIVTVIQVRVMDRGLKND